MAKQKPKPQAETTRTVNLKARNDAVMKHYNKLKNERDNRTGKPKYGLENVKYLTAQKFFISVRTLNDIIWSH